MSKENGGPAFPNPEMGLRDFNDGGAYPGMTLRAYAAIKLKVPDSGIDWLDEMIKKSLGDDFAAKAMQGICSHPDVWGQMQGGIAREAYAIADAMLAERSKP